MEYDSKRGKEGQREGGKKKERRGEGRKNERMCEKEGGTEGSRLKHTYISFSLCMCVCMCVYVGNR